MNQRKACKNLIHAAEKILSEIRVAMKEGKRQTAVTLAAQRYQILKELEELKCNHFLPTNPSQNSPQMSETTRPGYYVPHGMVLGNETHMSMREGC